MKYDKLVRDKIPQIMADNGQTAVFRILDKAEYRSYLEKKLDEEVAEFHESKSIEELVDISEVLNELILDMCDEQGLNTSYYFAKQTVKRAERGGFYKRICLVETKESEMEE